MKADNSKRRKEHATSKGSHRSSKKVHLTSLQKILMGKGVYAAITPAGKRKR